MGLVAKVEDGFNPATTEVRIFVNEYGRKDLLVNYGNGTVIRYVNLLDPRK